MTQTINDPWPESHAARVLKDQISEERDGSNRETFLKQGQVVFVDSDEGEYLIVELPPVWNPETEKLECPGLVPLPKRHAIPVPNALPEELAEDLEEGKAYVGDLLNDGFSMVRFTDERLKDRRYRQRIWEWEGFFGSRLPEEAFSLLVDWQTTQVFIVDTGLPTTVSIASGI